MAMVMKKRRRLIAEKKAAKTLARKEAAKLVAIKATKNVKETSTDGK